MNLTDFFREEPKVALGFSGGVDSSYLLYAGLQAGADIKAYYIKTDFQPQFERDDAERMARELGANLTVISLDICTQPEVVRNPENRCYYCKQTLFKTLVERAQADGYPTVIDGTNASDAAEDRPGMRALAELSVRSPLRECGLTKAEIRRLSKEAGLFTWNKPAYACLATRVPSGQRIHPALLQKVERAEGALFTLGFRDFRVRVIGEETAKIQLPEADLEEGVSRRAEIRKVLSNDFSSILLDLKGR